MAIRQLKAVSPLLAGALYVGIIGTAVLLVMQLGGPAVTKMRDAAAVDGAAGSLSDLDAAIHGVASEGRESSRNVPIQIKKGELHIDSNGNRIFYTLKTHADVVSPGKKRAIGEITYEYSNATSLIIIARDYSNTSISMGSNMNLYAGIYKILISNEGVNNGKTAIKVSRQ